MCGEKTVTNHKSIIWKGSPPLVRGKDVFWHKRLKACGITPACAGKRAQQRHRFYVHKDHPRLCGEKKRHLRLCRLCLGSPPLVRGKVYNRKVVPDTYRITPACAGKSSQSALSGSAPPGSPPLVRGKVKLKVI